MDITDFFLAWRHDAEALNREIRQLKNSENSETLHGNRVIHLKYKTIFYSCGITVDTVFFFTMLQIAVFKTKIKCMIFYKNNNFFIHALFLIVQSAYLYTL